MYLWVNIWMNKNGAWRTVWGPGITPLEGGAGWGEKSLWLKNTEMFGKIQRSREAQLSTIRSAVLNVAEVQCDDDWKMSIVFAVANPLSYWPQFQWMVGWERSRGCGVARSWWIKEWGGVEKADVTHVPPLKEFGWEEEETLEGC